MSAGERLTRGARGAAGFWRLYRSSGIGIVGLTLILGFVAIALIGPLLVGPEPGLGSACGPGEPFDTCRPLAGASAAHPFGVDRSGRDVLILVVYGSRISLLVGITATILSMLIGTVVGIIAGFYGGRLDALLMRVTDWFLVVPTLVVAIIMAALFGANLLNVIVIIGATSWPGTARIIRSQTLSVTQRAFVDRARAYGASGSQLMVRHVLPNVWSLVLANTSLSVSLAIFLESTLAFFGLSDPLLVSWGKILNEAFSAGATGQGKWGYVLAPGLCVMLLVLAFTFVGLAFDEILNPRLRSRSGGVAEDLELVTAHR